MERLKITLVGMVLVLTLVVGYGYGCGDSGDDSGGGSGSVANEADGTGADATTDGTEAEGGDSTEASDGGDGADGAPLTKAQFIKQGDAICQKVPEKYGNTVQELEAEAKKEKKQLSIAEMNLKAAVPPLPEAIEELEELVPPKGEEQEAEAIIEALEAALEGLEAKPVSELTGPKSPFDEFQKLTRKYGFQFCSQL